MVQEGRRPHPEPVSEDTNLGVEPMVDTGTTRSDRLVRRRHGRMIAGVAGGLADFLDVDVVWIRLGFVLATALGGAGIIAYVVLMILMPKHPEEEPSNLGRRLESVVRSLRGTPAWIGAGLLVIGSLIVLSQITQGHHGVFWGVALIVLGILLFRERETRVPERAGLPPDPAAVGAGSAIPSEHSVAAEGGVGAPPLPTEIRPYIPPVPRRRSALGALTLGVVLIAEGIAAALDLGGAVHVTLVQYLALALTLLGAGIAVGTVWGRARWLVAPALLLIPFVVVASVIKVPFEGGFGDRRFAPATAAAITSPYRIEAGNLSVDLSKTAFGPQPITVQATAVAGVVRIVVPAGATVIVDARTGAGEISLFGRTYDGLNLSLQRTFTGTVKIPPIHLDLETSLGLVEVRS